MLKIAIIGYGKMGQLVEQVALARGHSVFARVNSKNIEKHLSAIQESDICIDFSHPHAVVEIIQRLASMKKNLVIGTTGWYDKIDLVRDCVNQHQIGLIYSPNFSIGVYLFLKMVAEASSLINSFPEYDVGGFECHHSQKVDSPSGTAEAIGKILLDKVDRKKSVINTLGDRQRLPEEIHFSSLRCGSVPGTHTVMFDSAEDSITISHQARTREGFAYGAIKAGEWIQGKKGFYTMDDMMKGLKDGR